MSSPTTSWHRRKEFLAAVSAAIVIMATFASIGFSGTDTFFQQPDPENSSPDSHETTQKQKSVWRMVGNVSVSLGEVRSLHAEY